MSNFTSEEIKAAVERIVRSTVRHPTGILGDRKIDVSFSDLQEAAAGSYILYFNAPFYTVFLGASRLRDLVQTQANTASDLIDAVFASDRLVSPVSDLSPLANAKAALGELEAAVVGRSQSFQDIEKVPAFRRYAQNLNTFLQTSGSNVRGPASPSADPTAGAPTGTGVVDTPSGARLKIPGLARQLRDQHDEIIRRAKLLANAIEDFSSLNLPRIAAQGVISRAREVLEEHYTNLSAVDENQRLDNLRSVVLDLLTQKPLVEKYGAAVAPSEFITTSGLGTAFSDSTHLATPAEVVSTFFGPYAILETSHFIKFTMDGGASFEYPLPLGLVASLTASLAEPYAILADRDALRIMFDNPDAPAPNTYNVALTNGTRTATQVAAEINLALAGTDLLCEEVFTPLKYAAPVVVTSLGGNNGRFTILGGNLSGLDIRVGDELDILSGPQAGATLTITAKDPAGLYVDAVGTGPVVPVALPGASIEVGPAARALRLRDTNPALSLAMRRCIRLPRTGGDEDLGASILGFFPGMESRSRPVAAIDVANNINASTSQLAADTVFEALMYVGRARSEPSDAGRVVLSKALVPATTTGGTLAVFNLSAPVAGLLVGDALAIRTGVVASNINLEGVITTFTDTSITAFFTVPVTADAGFIEIGPNVMFQFGDVLNITDGINQGRYVVREDQGVGTTTTFELLLEAALPLPKDGADPVYFEVEFGSEAVRFKSRLQQTTSSVKVENGAVGTAAQYFFAAVDLPAEDKGTTSWLKFQKFPAASVGDLLQLYEAQYNVVSREFDIVGLEQGSSLVKITPELESDASFSFAFDVPNPFGRIRVSQVANFAEFKAELEVWLARPEQQEAWFRDLARYLNPILTNANPTVSQVNDAKYHLSSLLAELTLAGARAYGQLSSPAIEEEDTIEFALLSYHAPVEASVDTLLATFRQKGSDRAIDLLTEGQFTTFFNLNSDSVSYSGTLMASLRALARNDLPVRKFNRRSAGGQTLIGTIPQEKDFEFSSDDADSPDQPDIPASPDVSSPGENY